MIHYAWDYPVVNNKEGKPMTKLVFKNDKANTLVKMMEWSNDRPRRIPYTKEYTDKRGLVLVKDEGIYLMSPSDDNFVSSDGHVNTVVYARGYKPTKANRETLWNKTHAVSGDDFAEFINLTPDQITRVMKGFPIEIALTSTTFSIAV